MIRTIKKTWDVSRSTITHSNTTIVYKVGKSSTTITIIKQNIKESCTSFSWYSFEADMFQAIFMKKNNTKTNTGERTESHKTKSHMTLSHSFAGTKSDKWLFDHQLGKWTVKHFKRVYFKQVIF